MKNIFNFLREEIGLLGLNIYFILGLFATIAYCLDKLNFWMVGINNNISKLTARNLDKDSILKLEEIFEATKTIKTFGYLGIWIALLTIALTWINSGSSEDRHLKEFNKLNNEIKELNLKIEKLTKS